MERWESRDGKTHGGNTGRERRDGNPGLWGGGAAPAPCGRRREEGNPHKGTEPPSAARPGPAWGHGPAFPPPTHTAAVGAGPGACGARSRVSPSGSLRGGGSRRIGDGGSVPPPPQTPKVGGAPQIPQQRRLPAGCTEDPRPEAPGTPRGRTRRGSPGRGGARRRQGPAAAPPAVLTPPPHVLPPHVAAPGPAPHASPRLPAPIGRPPHGGARERSAASSLPRVTSRGGGAAVTSRGAATNGRGRGGAAGKTNSARGSAGEGATCRGGRAAPPPPPRPVPVRDPPVPPGPHTELRVPQCPRRGAGDRPGSLRFRSAVSASRYRRSALRRAAVSTSPCPVALPDAARCRCQHISVPGIGAQHRSVRLSARPGTQQQPVPVSSPPDPLPYTSRCRCQRAPVPVSGDPPGAAPLPILLLLRGTARSRDG